jgi:hypothetical protein
MTPNTTTIHPTPASAGTSAASLKPVDASKEHFAEAPKKTEPKVNPFEAATHFLLRHVVRHGDGVAAPQAAAHLEAITAAQADPESDFYVPPAKAKPAAPHTLATHAAELSGAAGDLKTSIQKTDASRPH